ncbi:Membrane frizzled-related protein, partial [Bienertia sinuspersici]
MERVSLHKEEKEIADHKNDDSFACETEVSKKGKAESSETTESYNDLPVENCHIIVSRTLQLQRNNYLAELSDQECVLADFLFYSEYNDVSMLSIDKHHPVVIQKNEELRHTLESSVLLDIINPANLDAHVCMTKTDFLSLDPKTWLTGASKDACSYLFNRREEEKPGNPRRFWFKILPFCHVLQSFLQGNRIKRRGFNGLHHWNRRTIPFTWRSNQNDFDCDVYCIKAMEWYDGWNEKKHSITTLSTAYTKNLNRCHLAIDLVSYKENRKKQEVFKDCALWSARKPFLIQQQKKRKDKEKHLENLRVKRVEKVFLEDEKIKKERERHEQEVDDFLNNDLDDSP